MFKRRKKRRSGRIDALFADRLEALITEKLSSLDVDALRDQISRISPEKAEALLKTGVDALEKHGVEKVWRDLVGSFDRGKLERTLREAIEKVEKSDIGDRARKQTASIDWENIDSQMRARIDTLIQERLQTIDIDGVVEAVRKQIDSIDVDRLAQQAQRTGKDWQRRSQRAMPSKRDIKRAAKPMAQMASDKAQQNPLASAVSGIAGAVMMTGVGWIAYSHLFVDHQVSLPKALPADQMTLRFQPTGPLNVYYDRQAEGRPLLLIHSVNAAASAYEVRPLFQHYRTQRPVYALDLPGYGFSARPDADYTPETFVQAIMAVLDEFDQEADIIAQSLGSEFAAEAARRRPNAVNSLTLISPTGFGSQERSGGMGKLLYRVLAFPLWARPFFDLLTIERSIRFFLQKSFMGEPNPGLVDYAYATAHQPGAQHAPLAFVTGQLFTSAALEKIYRGVETPTLVLYDRDEYVNFDRLPELLSVNSAWRAERIVPSLGLPHWEKLSETTEAIDNFWHGSA